MLDMAPIGFLLILYSTTAVVTLASVEVDDVEELNNKEQGKNLRIINKDTGNDPPRTNSTRTLQTFLLNFGNIEVNDRFQPLLPTSIEVKSDSILYTQPGQAAVINFEVTNNKYSELSYTFYATSQDAQIQQIQPQSGYISPGSSLSVRVTLSLGNTGATSQVSTGLVTFSARWITLIPYRDESVATKVYVRSGYQSPDSSKPSISYKYIGDCGGFLDPDKCAGKMWRADLSIQDSDSGLLSVKAIPYGLILNKAFVAGTTEEVAGFYRATCCLTKVEIQAKDIYGNEKFLYIDIERIWLSAGEIIAIVLGCILLLILIILIIWCIIRLCRRRRSLSIYPDSRS